MNDWLKAGEIAGLARDYGKSLIKEGEIIREILDKIDNFIIEKGGVPAFPSQISINHIAAHFCPTEDDNSTIRENDLVKLDVGACVNGAIGDTAITVDVSGNHENIRKASEDALNNVLKEIHIGMKTWEIGKIIEDSIVAHKINPIRNLGGHGLNIYNIHDEPHIPNFNNGSRDEIEEGMHIAIEPFATDGAGMVHDSTNPTIFSLIQKKPVRLPMMRDILNYIEKEYKTLPFTTRWISKKFGINKTNYVLNKLCGENILNHYSPLIENKKGMVSQHEHSLMITDKIIVTTKI